MQPQAKKALIALAIILVVGTIAFVVYSDCEKKKNVNRGVTAEAKQNTVKFTRG